MNAIKNTNYGDNYLFPNIAIYIDIKSSSFITSTQNYIYGNPFCIG